MDKDLTDLSAALTGLFPEYIDPADCIRVKVTNTVSDVSKSIVCSFRTPTWASDTAVGSAWLNLDETSRHFRELLILVSKVPQGWEWRPVSSLMDLFLEAEQPIILQSSVQGPPGPQGDQGPVGETGPQGPQGPKGLPGQTSLPVSSIRNRLRSVLGTTIQISRATAEPVVLPIGAFGTRSLGFIVTETNGLGDVRDISNLVQLRLSRTGHQSISPLVAKTIGSNLILDVGASRPEDLSILVSCVHQSEYPINPAYAEIDLPITWSRSTHLEIRGQIEYSLPMNWGSELELQYQLLVIDGVTERDVQGLATFTVEPIALEDATGMIRVEGSSVFLSVFAVSHVRSFVLKSVYMPTGSTLGYSATKEVTIRWVSS